MISIIIPTYNEEKYIGFTLEKLKPLTLPHEIIVTDDKSLDATFSIAPCKEKEFWDWSNEKNLRYKKMGSVIASWAKSGR